MDDAMREARLRVQAVADGAWIDTVYGRECSFDPQRQFRADLSAMLAATPQPAQPLHAVNAPGIQCTECEGEGCEVCGQFGRIFPLAAPKPKLSQPDPSDAALDAGVREMLASTHPDRGLALDVWKAIEARRVSVQAGSPDGDAIADLIDKHVSGPNCRGLGINPALHRQDQLAAADAILASIRSSAGEERNVRIAVWNVARFRGMNDQAAMLWVTDVIAALNAIRGGPPCRRKLIGRHDDRAHHLHPGRDL